MVMNDLKPLVLGEHIAAHVEEPFRALSDTSRVCILSVLISREIDVSVLAELAGISESAISHLHDPRQIRVVQTRRGGKEVYYRVDETT